jgi:hypothetical protein
VTRKFIVRLVVGNVSPGVTVLFRMSVNRGNVREESGDGLNERKRGLAPLSGAVSATQGPRSRSSQHQVNGSPSASLPMALSTNGVPFGMVKFGPALSTGELFVKAMTEVHALPGPEVMNDLIWSRLAEWK